MRNTPKLVNVDELLEFSKLEFKTYEELIFFFKKYSLSFWEENNIYVEKHHIIPRHEGGRDENNTVYLPFKYHFIAHCLLAEEKEHSGDKKLALANWWSANLILGRVKKEYMLVKEDLQQLKKIFNTELYELKQKVILNNKKIKKVYCIELNKTYDCPSDIAKEFGISKDRVGLAIRNKTRLFRKYRFFYVKDDISIEHQISEFKSKSEILHENRIFHNSKKYIDLKTKKVIDANEDSFPKSWYIRELNDAATGITRKWKGTYWALYDETKKDAYWDEILDQKVQADTLPGRGFFCPELNRHFTSSLHIEKELGYWHNSIENGTKKKDGLTFLKC